MRKYLILAGVLVVLTACQTNQEAQTLPTLAVLASATPTGEADEVATTTEPSATETEASATEEPAASVTASASPTRLPASTNTPLPTNTATPPDPTLMAIASSTASLLEAPRVMTLTPVPAGQNAPLNSTPQVLADLTITEAQFQEELNAQIADSLAIEAARVDFVENGIKVELTALGGNAYITGNVFLSVELSGNFIAISPMDIAVNAPEPPSIFVETVNGDFLTMILQTLDALLTQRLGAEHDLERLVLTATQMDISLLVPE